jgi:hypothetical protein
MEALSPLERMIEALRLDDEARQVLRGNAEELPERRRP